MAPKKPIKQEPEAKPAIKPYSIETQYGTMQAVKHTFNGKVYEQKELTSSKLEAIGEILIESDIFSAVKSENGSINVDAGLVMSHLIRKKLLRRSLVLLLTHEDGTNCTEAEFEGKASEFMNFISEVFQGFFTLNPDVLKDIGGALIAVLGTAAGGGQLIALLLAGRS